MKEQEVYISVLKYSANPYASIRLEIRCNFDKDCYMPHCTLRSFSTGELEWELYNINEYHPVYLSDYTSLTEEEIFQKSTVWNQKLSLEFIIAVQKLMLEYRENTTSTVQLRRIVRW